MTSSNRPLRVLELLVEDLRWAVESFVTTDIGGSRWVPRIARMALYRAMRSDVRSAPGIGFTFSGSPRHLTIAEGTYFNQQVFIEAIAPVTIGASCAFGMQSMVLTSHHPLDLEGHWQAAAEGRPVVIGDRVWVGARAVILPGAVVEDDVVIAAAAVVTGRCESGGVYAGVPAKRIRSFTESEKERT